MLLDALALYTQASLTLSDPAGVVPERHGMFPLTGAADALRNVYQNCDQLKGKPMPGTDNPAWRLLDEAEQENKQEAPKKP